MSLAHRVCGVVIYNHRFLKPIALNGRTAATVLFTREVSSKVHPDWIQAGKPGTGADHPSFKKIDLSFENVREAYKSKTNLELWRAYVVFTICSFGKLVDHQRKIFSVAEKLLGRRLMEKLLRMTFYGHFVAGADTLEIQPVVELYQRYGVKSILDYSVEEDMAAEKKVDPEFPSNGQETVETKAVMRQYRSAVEDISEGVFSVRTYAYEDEMHCDINMQHFLGCIDSVADATNSSGFAAVKVTALGRPELLMHISEVLVRIEKFYHKMMGPAAKPGDRLQRISEHQFRKGLTDLGIPISRDDSMQWFTWMDTSQQGMIDLFEWSNLLNVNLHKVLALPSLQTYTDSLGREFNLLKPLIPKVDDTMDEQFHNMIRRLNRIVEHARSRGVRIMIDAEQSYFQPAINRIAIEMMRQFNKEEAIVFNTYQSYTKHSTRQALMDLALSHREDFYFGCKLVRGAYIDQERARADEYSYDDPIWPTFYETTYCFSQMFEQILKAAKTRPKGRVSVMCATHNEESCRLAILKMRELGINPDDKIVCFGQLMGMSDQISFTLGQAGFSVYKYIPYGPTFEVMPYLMRRAQENRAIFTKITKERRLLRSEILRRMRTGQFFYKRE